MEIRWLWKTVLTSVLLSQIICLTKSQIIQQNSDDKNRKQTNLNLADKEFSDFTKVDLRTIDRFDTLNSAKEKLFNKNNDDMEEFIDKLSNQPHSRKKRLIWITDDGRLALPPGTSLTFTPTIAMPLVRYPPEGFLSNITISLPVTIDFDKLGLTDNSNPLGVLPPVFARNFGHAAGTMLGNYVANYLHFRQKREASAQEKLKFGNDNNFKINFTPDDSLIQPELPEDHKHVFHGGERALLYGVVEDFLATFGMNGKACLLRTICEVHSRSLERFGVFGEMIKLFLTATKSPFSDHIQDYVRAQKIGEGELGPGECFPYYKECPRSVFKDVQNNEKYSETADNAHNEEAEEILSQNFNDLRSELLKKKSKSSINDITPNILSM